MNWSNRFAEKSRYANDFHRQQGMTGTTVTLPRSQISLTWSAKSQYLTIFSANFFGGKKNINIFEPSDDGYREKKLSFFAKKKKVWEIVFHCLVSKDVTIIVNFVLIPYLYRLRSAFEARDAGNSSRPRSSTGHWWKIFASIIVPYIVISSG